MNEIQKNELNKLKRLLLENKLTTHNKNRLILFIETLEQENQQLKADYGNKAQVERDLLFEENKQLKEKLETSEKTRKEALNLIKSKEYVIDMFTFGYKINDYDIFKLKNILDIEKSDE